MVGIFPDDATVVCLVGAVIMGRSRGEYCDVGGVDDERPRDCVSEEPLRCHHEDGIVRREHVQVVEAMRVRAL